VIKETVASGKVRPKQFTKFGSNGNRRRPLVASRYFVVEQFEIDAAQEFDLQDLKTSAQILVATEGAAAVEAPGCEPVTFKKGDAVVIPATINTFRIEPQGRVQFVKSHVPGEPLPEPDTISD
jgi:mannose-6-phosphate isomerase class I